MKITIAEVKTLYGNYQYSLEGHEQEEVQNFLRRLSPKDQEHPAWKVLHEMTYANASWTKTPQFSLLKLGVRRRWRIRGGATAAK